MKKIKTRRNTWTGKRGKKQWKKLNKRRKVKKYEERQRKNPKKTRTKFLQALQIYELKVISYCIEMDLNRRRRSAAMTEYIPLSQDFLNITDDRSDSSLASS